MHGFTEAIEIYRRIFTLNQFIFHERRDVWLHIFGLRVN